MTYTLFIDESGDFERFRKRSGWVVSGVLCAGKRKQAEDAMERVLKPVARREGFKKPEDAHITDLRRKTWSGDHERVGAFAASLLGAARNEGASFFTVINRSGVAMWEPEQTYRLMLLDLVAMVDAAAPSDLDRLDLVIAQRKRYKAAERMSSKGELLADVVERVRDGVEAGLAARGLVDRLDGGACVVWKADDSWGLAAADAVANLTYNRRHRESREVLEALREGGGYQDFEAFGAYEERRARVAERDGDLSAAVARWARLGDSEARGEALARVWHRARRRGTAGAGATLEGAVELLMRGTTGADRDRAFEAVARSLVEADAASPLLYRVRDVQHLLANWRGDLDAASRLSEQQEVLDAELAADPTTLPLVFKSLVHRMTTTELRLDFAGVLRAARTHSDAVTQYGAVTEMLREATGVGQGADAGTFRRSRLWIKAQMQLARGLILVGGTEALAEAEDVLANLPDDVLTEKDQAMAACYRVWAAVRAQDHARSVEWALALVEAWPESVFALALGARAAADAHVLGGAAVDGDVEVLLEAAQRAEEGTGYPYDVLWRDVGVLEYARRGVKAAGRAFRPARAALDAGGESPVTGWKAYGLALSEAAARTPDEAPPPAPSGMDVGGATARAAAEAYRRVSPY